MVCRGTLRGLLVWYFVVVTGMGCFKEPVDEAPCSRFSYEYRVIEKLVNLENDKEAVNNKMADIESKCCVDAPALVKPVPLIALKARFSASKTAKDNERIVYDTIVSNIGNAYDVETGVFTAPVGGIYSFTVSVCLNPANWMVLAVLRNADRIGQFLGGDNAYHTCTNDYTTVKLAAYDKVWVEKVRGNTLDLNEDYGWNSFSANLLQAE